jgi:hypothetical protein
MNSSSDKVGRERFWFGGETVSCSECRHIGDIQMVSGGRESSDGIAMGYGLDGWGSIPDRGKISDRHWGATSSPIQWAPKLSGPDQNRIALWVCEASGLTHRITTFRVVKGGWEITDTRLDARIRSRIRICTCAVLRCVLILKVTIPHRSSHRTKTSKLPTHSFSTGETMCSSKHIAVTSFFNFTVMMSLSLTL